MSTRSTNAPIRSDVPYEITSCESNLNHSFLEVKVTVSGEEEVTVTSSSAAYPDWILFPVLTQPNQFTISVILSSGLTYLCVNGNEVNTTKNQFDATAWNISGEVETPLEIVMALNNNQFLTAPQNDGEAVTVAERKPTGNSQNWEFKEKSNEMK